MSSVAISVYRRKQRFFVSLVLVIAAVICGLAAYGGYSVSRCYLSQAKRFSSGQTVLVDRLTAEAFWPTPLTELAIGDSYYEAGDYQKAQAYYALVLNDNGLFGFVKSEYSTGGYQAAIDSYGKQGSYANDDTKYLIAESYLKLGNIVKARELLQTLPHNAPVETYLCMLLSKADTSVVRDADALKILAEPDEGNRYTLAYNALNSRGFPQAAYSLLLEGSTKGILFRDALNTLAQAQIDHGDLKGSFVSLQAALSKDAYYPQTYRQLITVGEKLGKDVSLYKERLATLSW